MKTFIVALASIFISGCSFIVGESPDRNLYVLNLSPCETEDRGPAVSSSLLVRNTQANSFYDSQKIVFSDDTLTRGYYQFAGWTESPARQITSLILERLQCEPVFAKVTRGFEPAITDYSLSTELLEFRHDAADRPGKVIVVLRSELYDLHSRELIASRSMKAEEPVADYNAEGAVKAFNAATEKILSELIDWLKDVTPGSKRSD
jgi:cholesterol transport system auxiliary component